MCPESTAKMVASLLAPAELQIFRSAEPARRREIAQRAIDRFANQLNGVVQTTAFDAAAARAAYANTLREISSLRQT